jgi:hypothetical protein
MGERSFPLQLSNFVSKTLFLLEVRDVRKIRKHISEVVVDGRLYVAGAALRIGADWWWWIYPGNNH